MPVFRLKQNIFNKTEIKRITGTAGKKLIIKRDPKSSE